MSKSLWWVGVVWLVVVGVGSPTLATTTTFRLGVCCDDEQGTTGCNSTPCNGDGDCTGGKICAGSTVSDRSATASGVSYPPTGPGCASGEQVLFATKSAGGGVFDVICIQVDFDTSVLPDSDVIIAASLNPFVIGRADADIRSLTGEYHSFSTCSDLYNASCGSDAFSVDITTLNLGVVNTFSLSNPTSISKTGTTGFRICISGGQPTSGNVVSFSAYDNITNPGTFLTVEHESGPTFTPTVTLTSTPTNTPANTATITDTPTITLTPTPTNTPVDTFTSTPTFTPANTPTITPTLPPSGGPSGLRGLLETGPGCCCSLGRGFGVVEPNFFAQGCYEGSGNDNRQIVTGILDPGFLIVTQKTTDGLDHDGMFFRIPEAVGDQSCYVVSAGTQCPTNRIQAQSVDGYFEVGTAQEVNTADDDYCWYQWSKGPNHVTFSYVGDGTGARTVDVGLESPDFALIRPTNDASGSMWARMGTMPANQSTPWDGFNNTGVSNITAMGPTGITVSAAFNTTGVTYFGGAWKNDGNFGFAFSWVGNGTSGPGGTCGLASDTQTINAPCETINVIAAQCGLDGCEGEACSVHAADTSVIRGRNIGTGVIGPGNIVAEPYAQGTLGDSAGLIGDPQNSTFYVTGGGTSEASLNDSGATYHGWATCAEAPTVGTVAPADWSVGFISVWHMEEASSTTRTNNNCTASGGGSGGTIACGFPTCDCDVDNNVTVLQDTTEKIIGSASALFASGDSDYLNRSLTTANELNINGNVNLSWGGFFRATSDNANRWAIMKGNNDFSIFRGNIDDVAVCDVTMTGGTLKEAFTDAGGWPADSAWVNVACVLNSTTDVLTLYKNAVASANTATSVTSIQDGSGTVNEFRFGRSAASVFWDGNIDEAWMYDGVLSLTDLCRIASCGVTGGACSCYAGNPAIYIDTGFNSTLGSNCVLPDCDKLAPGP